MPSRKAAETMHPRQRLALRRGRGPVPPTQVRSQVWRTFLTRQACWLVATPLLASSSAPLQVPMVELLRGRKSFLHSDLWQSRPVRPLRPLAGHCWVAVPGHPPIHQLVRPVRRPPGPIQGCPWRRRNFRENRRLKQPRPVLLLTSRGGGRAGGRVGVGDQ